jgi:hypothetical protein
MQPRYFSVGAEVERGIDQLSEEILRYLLAHPQAADTLEGIIAWWLPKPHRKMAREQVQQALDHLIARGLVTKTILANGSAVYASTARKAKS